MKERWGSSWGLENIGQRIYMMREVGLIIMDDVHGGSTGRIGSRLRSGSTTRTTSRLTSRLGTGTAAR